MPTRRLKGSPDSKEELVILATAEIKALNTTPIELVRAPGAGKTIVVDEIFAFNDFGTAAYVAGGAIEFRYTDGTGVKVSGDLPEVVWAEAAADAKRVLKGIDVVEPVENAAVVVFASVSDPITGDGEWKIGVVYRVVTLV